MKKLFVFVILVWCVGVLTSSTTAQAQSPTPLPLGITDLRGSADGFEAVRRDADTSKTNSSSLGYASGVLESKTFLATFTASNADDRLAIFSDDGCDVSIADVTTTPNVDRDYGGRAVRYLVNYNTAQALPALNESLHELTFRPNVNHTYAVTVRYSNVAYKADGSDIDGAKLYAYREVTAPPTPRPRTTVVLNSDKISGNGARLYWTEVPEVDGFVSYTLFFSASELNSSNLGAATKKLDAVDDRTITEWMDSGLQPATKYFYALRVRYSDNSVQDAYHSFTTQDSTTPRLAFTQSLRACPGHINNSVHKTTVTVFSILPGQDGTPDTPAKGITYKLSFTNNPADENGAKGASFLVPENGVEVEKKEIMVTSTDDPNTDFSFVSFTILSSSKITKDIQVSAAYTDSQNSTHEAGVVACDFGAVESKRHFGIVAPESASGNTQFDEGYDQDTGWRITRADDVTVNPTTHPYVATPQVAADSATGNTVLYKGEVFLRFSTTPGQPASRRYFLTNDDLPTDTTEPTAQLRGVKPNGSATDWLNKNVYPAVPGHHLLIKLGEMERNVFMPALPPRSDATLYFCNANGSPLGDEVEVVTDQNGIGTFYFKAGPQIMQASRLNFRALEKTQRR